MVRFTIVLLLAVFLTSCGGPSAPALTAQQVVDAFNAGGG
jgi:hypothetical protein